MIKRIAGTILVLVGAVIFIVLLTDGGPLFPHAIGPAALAAAGVALVAVHRKGK